MKLFKKKKKTQIGWRFGSADYDSLGQEDKAAVHILEARFLLTGKRDFTGQDVERWFRILTEEESDGQVS